MEEQYGTQPDGSYLTPYSHVVFYNPNSFVETALATLTEKTCAIPYPEFEPDWPGLADVPVYICPTVVLFDSYSAKIPVEKLQFLARGFTKVCIMSRRHAEYENGHPFSDYFNVFKYVSFGHEEIINMILEYDAGGASEDTHRFLRGMLFASYNIGTAVSRLAELIRSGVRVLDNIQRAQQRGVAIVDIGHHIGRSIAAGSQHVDGWVVSLITPLMLGEHETPDLRGSFKKYIREHIISSAKEEDKWAALIYPMPEGKWHVDTFAIREEAPPEIPRFATREELLSLIKLPWL